jgi:serine phosphatase RsbU (regulator of sigma subunit)
MFLPKNVNKDILLAFLFCFGLGFAAAAQNITELAALPYSYPIAEKVLFYEDKTNQLTLTDILSPDYQQKLRLTNQKSINFGFSASSFWLKIQVKNTTPDKDWVFVVGYPQLDYFEFYEQQAGSWKMEKYGDILPFEQRKIAHHNFVIGLELPQDSIKTYYLRARSDGALQMPMEIDRSNAFFQDDSKGQIGYGLYYGIMLTMILYNLFVFFSLRDINYIYYVCSIFSSTMFFACVSGYGFQHIWGSFPALNNIFTGTFMGLWVFFSAIFTYNFIDVKKYIPKTSKILYFSIFLGALSVLISVFGKYSLAVKVSTVAVALNVIIILICSIVSLFSNNKSARYFALAWFFFLVGTLLIVLSKVALIPTNFITTHGVEFGSVLEVLLLSFALSDRYKLIKVQNEQVQAENLRVQKEANETLESKVRQRTTQLQEANEELNQINEEMSTTLETVQKQKEEIEKKNFDITSSINYAKRIQNAMLPPMNEIKAAFPNSFILFKPKDIVSGDFYWFAEIKTENFRYHNARRSFGVNAEEENASSGLKQMIAVVDCTGHGVPGAMMSMIGTNLLNEIVSLQGITDADKILEELNKGVNSSLSQSQNENKDGMVISLCIVDRQQKTLEFAGAKHPLVYIQPNDKGQPELHIIKGNKNSIGGDMYHENEPFKRNIISIAKPTTFYTFSDGYPDQFGGVKNKKFMASQLTQLLFENHKLPVDMQLSLLDKTIDEWMWMGRQKQIDDILVIGVKL